MKTVVLLGKISAYCATAAFVMVFAFGDLIRAYPIAGSLIALWVVTIPARRWLEAHDNARAMAYAPDVFALSPDLYEQHCAALLSHAGWQAERVGGIGDQGCDVLAELRGCRVVVQCKLYRRRCGNEAVQQVVAARPHYGAQVMVVVCPAGFTASAQQLAASNNVFLMHHEELAGLARLARIS
jgi:restriction system protein